MENLIGILKIEEKWFKLIDGKCSKCHFKNNGVKCFENRNICIKLDCFFKEISQPNFDLNTISKNKDIIVKQLEFINPKRKDTAKKKYEIISTIKSI